MSESMLEIVDLGDATLETRQIFEATLYIDSEFGWGIFPDGI